MCTKNDDLLAKVGVNGQFQNPRDAYDREHGTYNDPVIAVQERRAVNQAPSPQMPFRLSGGR